MGISLPHLAPDFNLADGKLFILFEHIPMPYAQGREALVTPMLTTRYFS